MATDLLWLTLGLALLMLGGEMVVRGASGLARALAVSPMVIGLTVVAFGTSAPELAVNLIAAWTDRGDISFGNIIGSNMANIGLIVGVTALMRPILVTGVVIAREIPMMLLASAAVIAMALDGALDQSTSDVLSRSDGISLLLLFLVFLYYTIGDFVRTRANGGESPPVEGMIGETQTRLPREAAITALGLAALIGGADFTVDAASSIARILGVPEVVIGLTVLAVGTSLPELVASLMAALRGQAELAVGNIIGSNIFNLLLVAGLTALVRPIPVPPGGQLDLLMMALLSLMLFAVSMSSERRIVRGESLVLLGGYLAYIVWRSGSAT
jgi:cation:H+ antiporter